jgi:hypothetical protein
MGSFSLAIGRYVDKTVEQMDVIHKKLGLELLRSIVLMTPVDTGRARTNWFMQPFQTGDLTTVEADPTGGAAIRLAAATIQGVKLGGKPLWIYNRLPYIRRLEYAHWSKQAPQGMVRVSIERIRGINHLPPAEAA